MTYTSHVHEWVDCIVGCDDCGEHPAVRCDGEGDCEYAEPVDLIRHDDPREITELGLAGGAVPRLEGDSIIKRWDRKGP